MVSRYAGQLWNAMRRMHADRSRRRFHVSLHTARRVTLRNHFFHGSAEHSVAPDLGFHIAVRINSVVRCGGETENLARESVVVVYLGQRRWLLPPLHLRPRAFEACHRKRLRSGFARRCKRPCRRRRCRAPERCRKLNSPARQNHRRLDTFRSSRTYARPRSGVESGQTCRLMSYRQPCFLFRSRSRDAEMRNILLPLAAGRRRYENVQR